MITSKEELRVRFARRRDSIHFRDAYSKAISARVCALPWYSSAKVIHCYLPVRSEVDTRTIIAHALKQEKTVVVPVVEPHTGVLMHSRLTSLDPCRLREGKFGILQPHPLDLVDPEWCDIIIVPLLAFDHEGYRLGYGKGYYDQLLSQLWSYSIGVAFSVQQMGTSWYDKACGREQFTPERLPRAPHDRPLDMVVTESAVFRFGHAQGAHERPESASMDIL